MSEQETKKVAIRISEWTEWIPCFPDAATEGEVRLPQGVSVLEMGAHEKLMDIKTRAEPFEVYRTVIETPDGPPIILPDGEEADKDEERPHGKTKFRLIAFSAVMASQIAEDDEDIEPMITQELPKKKRSDIVTASAVPPNRAARRR